MEFCTQQQIEYYKKYFDLPKVIDEANKIVDAVKSSKQLNNDEKMASIILSYVRLQEDNKRRNK